VDPHYLSFINSVMPNIKKKGLGMIGMKSNAIGGITANKVATIEECLRFSLSQPVDTQVSGVETVGQLEQNVAIVKAFHKMSGSEITSLLERTRKGPIGAKVERYKKPEANTVNYRPHEDGELV
jgi:hypothetical protein